ncbi:MAG: MBL fold metallo-hydrolase [Syntrophomonadaceae bacterium]|nr:MBL fold metallo-hydrolase [Syntrophomonadaceae bacterium]
MLHKIDKYVRVVEFPGFHYSNCNCVLIEDEQRFLLDTGPNEEDLAMLINQPPDIIVNSHGHIDHYVFNHCFPDSRILMHAGDHAIAQSTEAYLNEFNISTLAPDPAWCEIYAQAVRHYPTRIDGQIHDNQWFDTGHVRFQVLHTPGHSPGHCCFFFPEQGFIFSIDIDFSTFGPWYASVSCSLSELLASIDRLADIKPDYYISGHGAPFIRDEVQKRLLAYRDTIFQRQRRVVDVLYKGKNDIEDMAHDLPVYQRLLAPKEIFHIYEQSMIMVHMRYLEELGYTYCEDGKWYLAKNLSRAKLDL